MINYIEKGAGMHEALARAGLSLWQEDGVWVTSCDPVEVQAFIEAYRPSKAELMEPIDAHCTQLLALVKEGIPEDEVLSWSKQEAEARAGGGPLTTALATARGIPLPYLLAKIIEKADAYAVYSGNVIGKRQSVEDQVDAGATEVSWPT